MTKEPNATVVKISSSDWKKFICWLVAFGVTIATGLVGMSINYERRFTQLETQHKNFAKTQDKIVETQDELVESTGAIEKISVMLTMVNDRQKLIEKKVDECKAR